VTGYQFPERPKKIFLVAEAPVTALWTTKPSMQLVPAALSLPAKWPEREVNHTHSVLEFGNSWNFVSTPRYVFMAWYVIKYRENFILNLYSHRTHYRPTSVSQRVLHESQGISEQLTGNPWINFCIGYFEVY
jgi:hypothetical protein